MHASHNLNESFPIAELRLLLSFPPAFGLFPFSFPIHLHRIKDVIRRVEFKKCGIKQQQSLTVNGEQVKAGLMSEWGQSAFLALIQQRATTFGDGRFRRFIASCCPFLVVRSLFGTHCRVALD